MTEDEFLNRVVCPQCKTKIDTKAPFTTGFVCNCRLSKHIVFKPSYGAISDYINHVYQLHLSNDIIVVVHTYSDPREGPFIYIAHPKEPLNPIFEQFGIPDYIFEPLYKLLHRIETLVTFA